MWTTEEMIAAWQIKAMFWLKDFHKKSSVGDNAWGNLLEFAKLLEQNGNALHQEQAKALRDLLTGRPQGAFNGKTYTRS